MIGYYIVSTILVVALVCALVFIGALMREYLSHLFDFNLDKMEIPRIVKEYGVKKRKDTSHYHTKMKRMVHRTEIYRVKNGIF